MLRILIPVGGSRNDRFAVQNVILATTEPVAGDELAARRQILQPSVHQRRQLARVKVISQLAEHDQIVLIGQFDPAHVSHSNLDM